MNPLIFSILCVFVTEVRSKKALLFNLKTRALDDVCHENGDKKCPSYLTACPASTPQEKQFNENISLSKHCVFSRLIYAENESERNIILNFCENPFEPVMLYDLRHDDYEIGYELYFEDGKISMTDKTYQYYKSVIRKKSKSEIKNETISANASGFVISYEDEKNVKFNFTDGSRTLAFYWIKVLSIKCSKQGKRSNSHFSYSYLDYLYLSSQNPTDECANYGLSDDNVYSKENQKKCLKDISAPPALFEGNPDLSCGQPYGCFVRSPMIPLWHFKSSAARIASCSHMSSIPVWKSIADGNLRRVDLFLIAACQHLDGDVIFGVSGVLKMKTSTGNNVTRKMSLSTSKHNRAITIPGILYRIFRINSRKQDGDPHVAAIIIHNDPAADPKTDTLCSETLSGWYKIDNDDVKTGLTYVCPMTFELNKKFGAYDGITMYDIEPLNLDAIPYYYSYTYPSVDENEAETINSYFENLLKRYSE
ncbi:uncharacterized protein LOC135847149 [Planococcus citri]|uniref:uncharacterized protein LOC135847149 n=1 Tax=Planococcus citri TaxID=170843 RepID=UPI0031F9C0D2